MSASVRSRSFFRGVLAVGLLGVAGCKVYDPALIISNNDGSITPQNCTPGTVGCIPTRPAESTSSDTDAEDMSFALRDILLTQTDPSKPESVQDWRSIGFNLDGLVTNRYDDATADGGYTYDANGCNIPPTPVGLEEFAAYPIDGNAGIDNQFGAQLSDTLLPQVNAYLQDDLCCMQAVGRGTVLLRVRKWNGQANDAQVTLSLTTALDGTSGDPSLLTYQAGTTNGYVLTSDNTTRAPAPAWTPDTDTWYTSAADVLASNLDSPRHYDADGYVAGGYLVMKLDALQAINLYLGHNNGISIGLRFGTLIARVSNNRHVITEGWIGGRMSRTELLDASYRLTAGDGYSDAALGINQMDPTSNANFCKAFADQMDPLITLYGDLLANGTNNPAVDCDALSAGVSFTGVRAKEIRLAPGSLAIARPDCGGLSAIFGTVTPEEATCPFRGGGNSCTIRTFVPTE